MDINAYLSSEYFNNTISHYLENIQYEDLSKIRSDFVSTASEAFNEGIMSMIQKKGAPSLSDFEKGQELSKLLPDIFVKGKVGQEAAKSILESIKMNQREYILNIGYETLVKRDIENTLRIVYALGVSTGFDISEDPEYKEMYLANKDRFILHGSQPKAKEK